MYSWLACCSFLKCNTYCLSLGLHATHCWVIEHVFNFADSRLQKITRWQRHVASLPRLFHIIAAVISTDVLVVLIFNMTGMHASKARSGTAGRVISSSGLSSAQGTHCRAPEPSCDAEWLPVSYRHMQAALRLFLPAVSNIFIFAGCIILS